MTTAVRAALAFSLLSGFYLLVVIILGATVAFDVWALTDLHFGILKIAALLSLASLALVRALWMVSRAKDGERPGVAVTREQEPELWRTVEELAERVRTAPPDEIRLVAEVNAAVSEDTRFLGLRATRRTMYIGLPLLQELTVDEMRAVLGHELGHYSGAHTRLGAPVYRGRLALIATVEGLDDHPWMRKVFSTYATLYLRISQAVSRRQELEADEFSVAIGGRRAASEALRKIHLTSDAWDIYMSSYVGMTGMGGNRPAEIFGGFRALVADPVRQAELAKAAEEPEETSPYDSHPGLRERLAAIAVLPEPALTPDARPASVLLRDPAAATDLIERSMWTPEALEELRPVSWERLVEEGMTAMDAEALHDLAVAGMRVMGTDKPYLDAAFEAIAQGRQEDLSQGLRRLDWSFSPTLVGGVLGRALRGMLVDRGLARWSLSWSGPAELRYTENGELVDVDDYAMQVAGDPAGVAGLREWVAGMGVPADYAPPPLAG